MPRKKSPKSGWMLLIGHDIVLKEALKRHPDFLVRCAEFIGLPAEQCLSLLLKGGHIPDLPDIEYSTAEQLAQVKGVKFRRSFLQQLLHIRKITWEVSQVMHSHRGLGSLGHSMYSLLTQARGPRYMGKAIVRRCAGWLDYVSRLDRHDMRLSLLGVILHAVIDSYAPGHTLRLTPEQRQHLSEYTCDTPMVPQQQPLLPGIVLAQALLRLDSTHTSVDINSLWQDVDLQAHFGTQQKWHSFWRRNEKEILGLQYMVQFEAQLDRMGQKHMTKAKSSKQSCRRRKTKPSRAYPFVVDFLSVNSTSFPVHNVSDWVRTLKKAGLYEFVIQDISLILDVFVESFTDADAAIQRLICHLSRWTFNTGYSIPLHHKINMDFFRARYCTEFG